MSRSMENIIEEQVDILYKVQHHLKLKWDWDMANPSIADQYASTVLAVYENTNKWLLSDKISSEKQGRMDAYNKGKETGQGGSGTVDMDSPTQAQIHYATTLGINVEGKSKKEVSNLIDKAKKSKAEKMGE